VHRAPGGPSVARGLCLRSLWRAGSLAPERAAADKGVPRLWSPGVGDRRHNLPSNADGSAEMVPGRLPDGQGKAWSLRQVSTTGAWCRVLDRVDYRSQAALWPQRRSHMADRRLPPSRRDLHPCRVGRCKCERPHCRLLLPSGPARPARLVEKLRQRFVTATP
jgi:hypothetical protein